MKLKSNRTLILAIILTSIVGLITTFDYLEKIRADFSASNDYLELSNYQGSPEPTRAEQWLNISTTAEIDREAGAVFVNLFKEGEIDEPVDVDFSYLGKAPNLIYASLASNQWQSGQKIEQEVLFERLKQAPWHLDVSWNSPRQVFTQDKVSLEPKLASFWREQDHLLLALNDRVLVVNDEYSQKLAEKIKQALASKQTEVYDDDKVSLKYPQRCKIESSFNQENQVHYYALNCPQGDQAGVTVHIVPQEAASEYNLGNITLNQEIAREISNSSGTGSSQIESEQRQVVERNGKRLETTTKTQGQDLIVATSVDADLLEEVVSSIEIK